MYSESRRNGMNSINEQVKQISQRIKELRDIIGLEAREVAEGLEISEELYNEYENGEREGLL